jgi:hypothetical protein
MILEAVASHDLWIWHAYFGLPGSCNDINVLQRSPVFSAYARGETPPVEFTVNGHAYDMGYYLADGTTLIVEDEKSEATNTNFENIGTAVRPSTFENAEKRRAFIERHHKLRNKEMHTQLQNDLIEHNWRRYGSI